jgi:hypothetical protein
MASSAPIILESIAVLEKELARLKSALADSGVPVPSGKTKKAKAPRNPDAPPPKANAFFDFLNGRVRPVLKEHKADMKLAGTVAPAFAKHLLSLNPEDKEATYALETDAILAAFDAWATPENLAAPPRKAKDSDSASESASVAGSEAAPAKPKRVLSEEQKAKMKAGREAAKAKKEAEAQAAKAAQSADSEEAAAPVTAAAAVAAVAAPKKVFAKKEVKKTWTLAQLQNWDEGFFEGDCYGVNERGDVINGDGEFQGHWDGKTLDRKAPLPADWALVMG